jgi:hypothetical protein
MSMRKWELSGSGMGLDSEGPLRVLVGGMGVGPVDV